jgi:hypothetical protein
MKLSMKLRIMPGVLFAEGKFSPDAVHAFDEPRRAGESTGFEFAEFVVVHKGEVGWDAEGFLCCHTWLRGQRVCALLLAPFDHRRLAR